MRGSNKLLLFSTVSGLLLLVSLVDSAYKREQADTALEQRAVMVEQLGLTDLALFTEARYTRHISQADLHSAFQDHPMALEHFPSGSILPPPQRLK